MKTLTSLFLVFALVAASAAGQTGNRVKPVSDVSPVYAGEMYMNFCASCHGEDGKGKGPAAKSLRVPPADLTMLAAHNNGVFPEMQVMAVLGGAGATHGSSDMPVWGNVFRSSMEGELRVWQRIYNLTKYVDSIQEPANLPAKAERSSPPPRSVTDVSPASGSSMYRAFCASCHGGDARGSGPLSPALSNPPGDLTLLSRNNQGKFPQDRLTTLLGRAPGTDAHGSQEMPVWGNIFRAKGEDQMIVTLRIANLIRYLESIQR